MGFSGGIWTPPSLPGSWSPAISGQAATPTDWNTLLTAIAGGLSTMICRDGQSTVTADIPFANFRLKGVGAGVLSTDAANMSQLVSGAGVYALDTGIADAYLIAPVPGISAYAVGQLFRWKVAHANATTTPTLAISGLTAGTITWPDGTALAASDLPANAIVETVVTSATPTFQLLTRSSVANQSVTAPTTQTFTSGTAATYTRPAGVKWIKVRMIGGGGGGGGSGGTTGPTGGTGGTTSFNAVTVIGGTGGTGSTATPTFVAGAGGTGGTGITVFRMPGGIGNQQAFGANAIGGGAGGNGPFGGAGGYVSITAGALGMAGSPGATNSGAGGGGAAATNTVAFCGNGGGAGEYAEMIIGSPAGTYTYTVGAGGAGGIGTGTSPFTGGAGAAGIIIVEEHYNT